MDLLLFLRVVVLLGVGLRNDMLQLFWSVFAYFLLSKFVVLVKLLVVGFVPGLEEDPWSVSEVVGEIAVEDGAVGEVYGAEALLLILEPLTHISLAVGVEVHAFAVFLIVEPGADVKFAVLVVELALAVLEVVEPLAFILVAICKLIRAGAIPFLVQYFPEIFVII